jgi:hypothetical protein
MYFDQALVGTTTCMARKLTSTSKNPPSASIDEKFVGCSTSIGCLVLTSIGFFSTYSSSLELLIITNIGVEGENCLQFFFKSFSHSSNMF